MMSLWVWASALLFAGYASAGCKGLLWAIYPNPFKNEDGTDYPSFDPTVFQTMTPEYSALTYRVGGFYSSAFNTNNISIYGSSQTFSPDLFVLNHKGYLHVKEAGQYTYTITNVDDIFLLWTGQKAYTTWNRANSDCSAIYNFQAQTNGSCSFTDTYTAGEYVPVRFMFGQDNYPAYGYVTVTGPSGEVILSSKSKKSHYAIQHGCGKQHLKKAPRFPVWGKE